jgi:hypothetical protein
VKLIDNNINDSSNNNSLRYLINEDGDYLVELGDVFDGLVLEGLLILVHEGAEVMVDVPKDQFFPADLFCGGYISMYVYLPTTPTLTRKEQLDLLVEWVRQCKPELYEQHQHRANDH